MMVDFRMIWIFCITPIFINGQQQLDCNFDLSNTCNWNNGINGNEDDFDWQIGDSVAVDGFHSIPRTVTGTGRFAYAQGKFRPAEIDSAKAWLRSPIIDGLTRQATLSFNLWKTAAPPSLMICTRDTGIQQPRCIETISGLGTQDWVRHVSAIPPNPLPFQLILIATNFRTALDLIGLDDIQFRMSFEENATLETELDMQLLKPHVHRRNDAHSDALDERRPTGSAIVGKEPSTRSQKPSRTRANESIHENDRIASTPSRNPDQSINENDRTYSATTREEIRIPDRQQQQQQLELRKLLELRQKQQFQQAQLAQQFQSRPNSSPSPAPAAPGFGRFQISDPLPTQATPNFVIPPLPTLGPAPQPILIPSTDGSFFGPPLPPLPRNSPVERSEPDIDAPSTQILSVFFPHTTSSPAKFTLPSNWFRTQPGRNDLDDQQLNIGQQLQAPESNLTNGRNGNADHGSINGHDHGHDHNHEHGEFSFGACQAVACTFETSLCNWYNDLNANFDWKLKNNHSQYQGIPQDFSARPSYLFVSGDQRRPDQRAVVRSQPFVAPSGVYLEFFTFLTDPTITRLSAYRNVGTDQPNVLWQTLGNGQIDKNNWQRVRVPLPASSFPMTISIVADQLSTGQYIGLDDLRLVDNAGIDVGCASDAPFTNLGSTRAPLLTPFPPKDGLDDNLQTLAPLKAAALLNNPDQQFQSFNASNFPLPNTFVQNPFSQSQPTAAAAIQQRRIGVIETQGSFGGDPDLDDLDQLFSNNTVGQQQQNGVSISSVDKNGQRRGLLQSIERQSQQWNVFQPARPDQLPREIIFATQLVTTIDPITNSVSSISGNNGPALRSVDPIFPPGDSPEINDQDTFHGRRGNWPTNQYTRSESIDQDATTTTTNPDPLGFQDFVSSLTKDLQVLAGGGVGTITNPWHQSGSPLSNFNQRNTPASSFQPQQSSNNPNWLSSLLGKRK